MNKKIISVFALLIIFLSLAFVYNYFMPSTNEGNQSDDSDKTVNDEDLTQEIDDSFIEEDSELDIGEMV